METKQRYSDQEVRNLLHILEAEKKSVRNLRKRIAALESAKTEAESLEEETQKLRRMVEHYRGKYEAKDTYTDEVYRENEKLKTLLQKEREAFRSVQIDLEENCRYIGELQEKLERGASIPEGRDASEMKKQMELKTSLLDNAEAGKSQALETLCEREEELEGLRQDLERVQKHLAVEKQNSGDFVVEIEEKNRLLAEYESLQNNYQSSIEKRRELEGVIQEETDQIKLLEDKNKQQEKELQDANLHGRQLEKGIQYLREKLEEAENSCKVSLEKEKELAAKLEQKGDLEKKKLKRS